MKEKNVEIEKKDEIIAEQNLKISDQQKIIDEQQSLIEGMKQRVIQDANKLSFGTLIAKQENISNSDALQQVDKLDKIVDESQAST